MSDLININNLVFGDNSFITLQEINKRLLLLYNAMVNLEKPTATINYATSSISGVTLLADTITDSTNASACVTTEALISNEFPQFLYGYINFTSATDTNNITVFDNNNTAVNISIKTYNSVLQGNLLFITGELTIDESLLNTGRYINTITIPKNSLTSYFNTGKILFCSFNLEKSYYLKSSPVLVKNNINNIEICIKSKKEDTDIAKVIKLPFVILFEGTV